MEQVVLMNCALAAHRAGRWGPSARADGTQDAAPTGLRTTYLTLTAVKRAGVAAISNVQQRTITEEQWLLSPGGATSLMPLGASPRLPSRSRPGGE